MSEAKKLLLGLLIGLASTVGFLAIIATIVALNKSTEHEETAPSQPQVAQHEPTPAPKPAPKPPAPESKSSRVAQHEPTSPEQPKPAPITPAKAIQPFWTINPPAVIYDDKRDVNSNIISASYSTDKELLGSIIIGCVSKGQKPTRPTLLSPAFINVVWPHTDKAPQHISFGKGPLYDCTPDASDHGYGHGVTILLEYSNLYELIQDNEITVIGDQPIFTLDKKVKLAIKAYLEANSQLPVYEGEPIVFTQPVKLAAKAYLEAKSKPQPTILPHRPSKLQVTYYGPRDKDTPDQTFVSFNLYNLFNVPGQSLDLWITHDHRTPQRISGDKSITCDIHKYGPKYEYTPSDEAVIRSGDTLLGTKARCEQELRSNMSKNIRYCECFHTDITIEALKQALDSDQSITIQIGDHPATTLSSTSRAEIKEFIDMLQSGSYPEGTLEEDIDESKASGFGKPLAAPSENTATETLTVDLLDTTWETSSGYIYIYVKIRNTSNTALKYLKVTATLERQDNSLVLTDFSYLEPTIIESGGIALAKLMIKANPLIHHYNLTFEAKGRVVKFKNRTQYRQSPGPGLMDGINIFGDTSTPVNPLDLINGMTNAIMNSGGMRGPVVGGHYCGAMTLQGTPCARWVVNGLYCYQHGW